jgi:hypothetical protein
MQLCNVVVGKVKLDKVDAFGYEIELRVLELIAGKNQDFKFLWGDDSFVEKVVSGIWRFF